MNYEDIVFVWIPKNAGTSIWQTLYEKVFFKGIRFTDGWQEGNPATHIRIEKFNQNPHGFISTGHLDFVNLYKRNLIDRQYLDEALKFCVIRNPWDRTVSLYHHLYKSPEIRKEITFADFCHELKSNPGKNKHPKIEPVSIGYNVCGYSQANPQYKWIVDENGNLLVDEILRFETLDKDFKMLLKKMGVKRPIRLPKKNKTKHKHYKEYYTKELWDLVAEIYKKDIELWYSDEVF